MAQANMSALYFFEPLPVSALYLTGKDALPLLQRLSTNDLLYHGEGKVKATLFLNAQGRVLERALVRSAGEDVTLFLPAGREQHLAPYLQKNIFFRDEVSIARSEEWLQLEIHGSEFAALLHEWQERFSALTIVPYSNGKECSWSLFCTRDIVEDVVRAMEDSPLNVSTGNPAMREYFRVKQGIPAIGHELSTEYIPLELGLWEEVSFTKGCYVGQEIIARMESRRQLARILVTLELEDSVPIESPLYFDDRRIGKITSIARSPEGNYVALAVIRREYAIPGAKLNLPQQKVTAVVQSIAGQPPDWVIP
ncbi:MAG: hypothetical protein OXF22_01865 [Anaerolineaceae bacterium]|nr:hypothetical protein [Chloroflexota bacterium]MCY4008484.1 hypothetical protein [Anaerolineaceae bacterium]